MININANINIVRNSGGGSFDQQLLNSNPEFWIRADRVVDGVVTDLVGNYSPTVINSPVVIEDSINGQPAINLVASEQNGIHIGAVSNFTQFTAVCFFKCDDTSLNGLLFDCYSSASAFANNGFGIRTMSNQLQIILRKNGSNTQHS